MEAECFLGGEVSRGAEYRKLSIGALGPEFPGEGRGAERGVARGSGLRVSPCPGRLDLGAAFETLNHAAAVDLGRQLVMVVVGKRFTAFAYCGLVGNPHLTAKIQIVAPLPTSTR